MEENERGHALFVCHSECVCEREKEIIIMCERDNV